MMSQSHCSGSSSLTGPSESKRRFRMNVTISGKNVHTEEVIEQLAAVFVGMKSVVDVGLQTGIDMTIV